MSRLSLLVISAVMLTLSSCTKEDRELMYADQEAKIESFVSKQQSSNPDARVIHNGGSTRIVMIEGEGVELNARGRASILYAGYDFSKGSVSSSSMFVTNSKEFANASEWEISDESIFEPLVIDLTDKDILQGLLSGLEGVREGEECYILFSGKYAYGKSKIGTIPANSPLAFRIWVQGIEN